MRRVTVLVVDDHQMLREALVGMLELSGFEVVGTVADGADATSMAAELAPDVVLMDLSVPVLNGLDATRLLREVVPATAIVIFSAFETADLKRQAFAAGAGFRCGPSGVRRGGGRCRPWPGRPRGWPAAGRCRSPWAGRRPRRRRRPGA